MDFERQEFEALRATIRQRGSLRYGVVLVSTAVAALIAALGIASPLAAARDWAALVALMPLVAGTALAARLHETVERIGQYLRVYYEESRGQALWESRVAAAPSARGGSPIFAGVFAVTGALALAVAVTAWPAWLEEPGRTRRLLVIAAYGLYAAWTIALDRACRGAKARELARWQALSDRALGPSSGSSHSSASASAGPDQIPP